MCFIHCFIHLPFYCHTSLFYSQHCAMLHFKDIFWTYNKSNWMNEQTNEHTHSRMHAHSDPTLCSVPLCLAVFLKTIYSVGTALNIWNQNEIQKVFIAGAEFKFKTWIICLSCHLSISQLCIIKAIWPFFFFFFFLSFLSLFPSLPLFWSIFSPILPLHFE